MPRAALIPGWTLAAVLSAVAAVASPGLNPHLNPSVVLTSCAACHRGHGLSRSPMLPAPQLDLCLACHGFQADFLEQANRGVVAFDAEPTLLGRVLAKPHVHPLEREATTRYRAITCTSCHAPHRSNLDERSDGFPGRLYLSPRNPLRFEYELCESCHGSAGAETQNLTDVSRLVSPENPSYHPVEAPALHSSPSVASELSGHEINCTDCHGNSDRKGPRGPHGSDVPFLLKANYTIIDGSEESGRTYALCYRCHVRDQVLDSLLFPLHRRHVVDERASCATCHNPHGSVRNRALIRFGEETRVAGVSPSATTGRLAFVSDGPGSGACYVNCHGREHGPEEYGAGELMMPGHLAPRPAWPPPFADRPGQRRPR